MGVTIKDIAKKAGVSIATVSHIINKTRYVSPELVQRVHDIINETGYVIKHNTKENNMKIGRQSIIAYVVPTIETSIFSDIAEMLTKLLLKDGYILSVYITCDDAKKEKHILQSLIANKLIAGIIFAPESSSSSNYKKVLKSDIPLVLITRGFSDGSITSITSENIGAIYNGTSHLIKRGHSEIAMLVENRDSIIMKSRIDGYRRALNDNMMVFDDSLIVDLSDYKTNEQLEAELIKMHESKNVTAFITAASKLTLVLLGAFQNIGIDCPDDISVVGFGDPRWDELLTPPLTSLNQDTEKIAQLCAENITGQINGDKNHLQITTPVKLNVRKSTCMIGRGPFGERSYSPEEITFTPQERNKLREGNYKVAISFHYSGTAWTHLHEKGIRDTLENFGISVISVTDASFDPALQNLQLDAIKMQGPDLVIAIPADDKATAKKFRELARTTKLVFISSVPEGMCEEEYCSCVSVNERENGLNLAVLIGEYYKDAENVNIGLIQHGARFYGTSLRDMVAEQTLREQYPNIKISDIVRFNNIDNTYDVCRDMILRNKDINAIYVSWDRPALEAIRAIKDLGRDDICVFTFDIDVEICKYFARGEFVKGISTQRPYEQGEAVALAAAKALVSDRRFKYVGVAPYTVKPSQLLRAWKDIMHDTVPEEILKVLKEKSRINRF